MNTKTVALRGLPLPDATAASLREAFADDADTLDSMLAEAGTVALPKYIITEAEVRVRDDTTAELNGVIVRSRWVAQHLADCEKTYAYIATCGRELDAWAESRADDDPIEGYIASEICKGFLYATISAMREDAKTSYGIEKLAALNPGSLAGWPLDGQRELFAVAGGCTGPIPPTGVPDEARQTIEREVGVTLTQSYLMLPYKSASGVLFYSDKEYENCMFCPRADCPNRRAPFTGRTE